MQEFLQHYGNIAVFFGMFFAGETVLFPSIYLAIIGFISWQMLIVIAVVANVSSDFMWYSIGRWLKSRYKGKKIYEVKFLNFTTKAFKKASEMFEKHGPKMLIGSKFIYGTRSAVQIVAGYKHMSLKTYFKFNSAAILVWLTILVTLGALLSIGFLSFGRSIKQVELILGVFFVIIVPITLWIRIKVAEYLSAR